MITVVLADDHRIFVQGLCALLSNAGDISVVGTADNGAGALQKIQQRKPDIAVLDISMPAPDGIEVALEIRMKGLATKVIILTAHSEELLERLAFKAGVQGYVLKDNAFEELIDAISTVCSGEGFVSPSLSVDGIESAFSWIGNLTNREKDVLSLVASGLTNRQISETLCISIKTVETHRTRIMRKLDVHNTADLVRYAVKRGIA